MQSTDRVAASGMVIAERYRLIEPLGAGGMGAVWRAEHLNLRSPVAVKVLNTAIADDPEMLDRFLREAQSAAALRGNYVVQVFDYGVHGGLPFIAMELLSGLSLGRRLALVYALSTTDLAWIFGHVSRAVSKAHELGIVHRDLKPDNIFIVRDGDEEVAKVLDFGIAKVLPSSIPLEDDSGQTTRTGTVLGTPFYMSPEQARGNKTIDYRADLWSMGVIAFECLTGQLPFTSSALGDLVVKICTHSTPVPSSVAEVPEGFDQWFFRACQKAPEDRFQSMREQNDALQAVLGHVTPPLSPNRSTPRGRRIESPVAFSARELARDFGEFQTLESLNPQASNTPKPAASLGELAAAVGVGAEGPPSSTHSTPAGMVLTEPRRSSRVLPALVIALVVGIGLFVLRRVNSKPDPAGPTVSVAVPEAPPSVASTTKALEVTPNQPPAVASPTTEVAASQPGMVQATASQPVTSESAPMDTAALSAKLRKKTTGSGLTAHNQPTTKAPQEIEATPSAATSTPAATASASLPELNTKQPASDAKSRGRGLFDDRE